MNVRRKWIVIVLLVTTLDWALWTGGQFFNLLMVVPGWSYDAPETIRLYQQNMLSHDIAYFFLVANPVFLLLPVIIAWISSLRLRTSFVKWFGGAVLCDLVVTLIVGLWMAPTARRIFSAAARGTRDFASVSRTLHYWKMANGIRVVLEIVTLFLFLMAILKFNEADHSPLRKGPGR
jgi:hypothetical protein